MMFRNIFASAAILACLAVDVSALRLTTDAALVSDDWISNEWAQLDSQTELDALLEADKKETDA